MRLVELTKPEEVDHLRRAVSVADRVDNREREWTLSVPEILAKHGFEQVGEGKYGMVFTNEKYPYALKIFMKDTAYIKWLSFCRKNQNNPFVPQIRGSLVKITDLIYAVRIEKLESWDQKYMGEKTPEEKLLLSAITTIEQNRRIKFNDVATGNEHIDPILSEFIKNRKLLDVHADNLMMRKNGQTVIIDPYYNWFDRRQGQFTIDPDKVEF